MIDIKLDEKKLRLRLVARALTATTESLFESKLLKTKFGEKITDEDVARAFEKAVEHAVVARALLEIINAQMTEENEVIFDRIVEETAEQVATSHAEIHDKIVAASEVPKVQA